MIQQGLKDELLSSKAIWMCVSCETCGSRCPNGIYLSPIMDALRSMAREEKKAVAEPAVLAFHEAFVGSAKRFGRVHEATMLLTYKWATKDFLTDVGVGLKLFAKGKIPLLPKSVKGKAEIAKIFEAAGAKV
jgi:heterodisulfide reductase subunit C